ncbi:hypothetical protein [Yinghuangia seranimata]|uniref:hypothetical protein n=1 Tax=Yinghuangia seranimata TaxID=408067 RepID=UPI00248ADB2A|nr:hypothetical protein [Yinghuangia seranimata]MDI2128177.1 hypothetical protein [Yinghuangia seranimata]
MSTRQSPPGSDAFEEELIAAMRSFTDERQPRAFDPAEITGGVGNRRRAGWLVAASVAAVATVGGVLAATLAGGGGSAAPAQSPSSVSGAPSRPAAPPSTTGRAPESPSSSAPDRDSATMQVRRLYQAITAGPTPRADLVRPLFDNDAAYATYGSRARCGFPTVNGALFVNIGGTPDRPEATVTLYHGRQRLGKQAKVVLSGKDRITSITCVDLPAGAATEAEGIVQVYGLIASKGPQVSLDDPQVAATLRQYLGSEPVTEQRLACSPSLPPHWVADSAGAGTTSESWIVTTASPNLEAQVTLDGGAEPPMTISCLPPQQEKYRPGE